MMTADIEMLPLPEWTKRDDAGQNMVPSEIRVAMADYGHAVAEHNVAARDAEIEALRADAWRVADAPPDGEMGFWTKDVITVSNYGTACTLSYFHSPDGGVWQRPSRYCKGEEVMMWRPIPANDQERKDG